MCNCIDNIEKSQLESQSIRSKRKLTSFEFTEDSVGNLVNFSTGKGGRKTKSTVRYTLEGLKKIHRSFMVHNFCPFCGKAYK